MIYDIHFGRTLSEKEQATMRLVGAWYGGTFYRNFDKRILGERWQCKAEILDMLVMAMYNHRISPVIRAHIEPPRLAIAPPPLVDDDVPTTPGVYTPAELPDEGWDVDLTQ